MTLAQLWEKSPEQFADKKVQQVIAFAGGGGKLRDGGEASDEFRSFLRIVPSKTLEEYVRDCLAGGFDESGYALQDIVNEIGRRLGYSITYGRYRGVAGKIGYDGLWELPQHHSVIVEVKTTDTYRVDIDTIAGYRTELIRSSEIDEQTSSILIVVGRDDTGGLEAQVRGSRHAWEIRLISVDALLRLLVVKESTDDPKIHQQIASVLVPKEFTRLDGIIDLVFSTVADLSENGGEGPGSGKGTVHGRPTSKSELELREASIARVQKHLKLALVKRSRVLYGTPDESILVMCAISKEYSDSSKRWFWFAMHDHQEASLRDAGRAYVALACGSEKDVVFVPFKAFSRMFDRAWRTERGGKVWWHIVIERKSGLLLLQRRDKREVDLSPYLLS